MNPRPDFIDFKESTMNLDRYVKFLLSVIAVSLGAIALRPYLAPPLVKAEAGDSGSFYVEPGTFMLRAPDGSRQQLGKVVVDMRSGNVWGFPTLSPDPYPSSVRSSTPPTSHPFLLGRFAVEDVQK
jgi:hypothetical protein